MTTIMIGKALATVTENEILTSGMINAKIKFVFSDDWYPALSKTAIFTAGDVTKVVLDSYWENNVCSIPQECLAKSDEILMVGIYGADNANVVAIPTVWATVGKIRKGYEGYEDVSTGTLPIWAQVQSAAAQSATAAKNAQDAAEAAQGKAEDAQAAAEAAQTKAETAQSKAEAAQGKAEAANTSAQSAKTDAESAKSAAAGSAQSAGASAQSAQASSKLSESWAVGGTGTRTGEDTNNAKYWAMAALEAAGGGVTSFNGRSGAVAPQKGDYTATMVGADAQGAAQTVQGNLNVHAGNTVMHITAAERTAWNGKQNALTFDTTPTEGSTNPVTSGGVKAALHSHDNKAVLDGITAEKVTEWDSALHSDDLYTSTLYPNFVNQLPISKDEQGDVYNGVGYKTYQQLNSDGTVTPTGAANVVSGYIPVKNGSIIRLDGFELPNAAGGRMVVTYDAEYNKVQHSVAGSIPNNYYFRDNVEYSDADQTKIKQFSISHQPTAAYLRICTYIDHMSGNPIVTVDEEITYSETGKKFLPTVHLDYSQIDNVPETDTKAYTPILPTEHLSIAYSSIGRKPINTIEHFVDCAENYGYNGLKCDVRPTSDGELICCHDAGFSFDGNGKITTYNASDATMIHDVTAATCIGYEFATGEHPCLVGDYLAVCRKYGKVAFVTIRNEYMDVVIPKLISEINLHHMQGATIINSMTYASLVRWREIDEHIALNYTLERGANITPTEIDKAVALGNCSMSGFGFGGGNAQSDITCDFAYAASKGIRLTNAICQVEGSYENAIAEGYDGAHIGYPWGQSVKDGTTPTIGANGNWYIGDADTGKPSRGDKDDKGDPGPEYVLTDADKTSIKNAVIAALPVYDGGVV